MTNIGKAKMAVLASLVVLLMISVVIALPNGLMELSGWAKNPPALDGNRCGG